VVIDGPEGDVATRRVTLDAGASTQVTAVTRLTETGEYRFTAGDRSVVVAVTAATPTDAGGLAPGTATPGFGPWVATLAFLALLFLALGRRQ
jgi:hypothetical protein